MRNSDCTPLLWQQTLFWWGNKFHASRVISDVTQKVVVFNGNVTLGDDGRQLCLHTNTRSRRDLKTLSHVARCFLKHAGIILRQEVRGFSKGRGYGWPSALVASTMNVDNHVLKSSGLATSKMSWHFSAM